LNVFLQTIIQLEVARWILAQDLILCSLAVYGRATMVIVVLSVLAQDLMLCLLAAYGNIMKQKTEEEPSWHLALLILSAWITAFSAGMPRVEEGEQFTLT
jgi:hypothetical protein